MRLFLSDVDSPANTFNNIDLSLIAFLNTSISKTLINEEGGPKLVHLTNHVNHHHKDNRNENLSSKVVKNLPALLDGLGNLKNGCELYIENLIPAPIIITTLKYNLSITSFRSSYNYDDSDISYLIDRNKKILNLYKTYCSLAEDAFSNPQEEFSIDKLKSLLRHQRFS